MVQTISTKLHINVKKQLENLKLTETESISNVIQRLINYFELKNSTTRLEDQIVEK